MMQNINDLQGEEAAFQTPQHSSVL